MSPSAQPSIMILFDIDGTLLYTGGAGRIAFEKAFEEMFGVPKCWGGLIPDGKTDKGIIDEISTKVLNRRLDAGEYVHLEKRYHDYFRIEIKQCTAYRLMPGVPEILAYLHSFPHLLLGIATGNFEEAAWSKLETGGIRHYFRFGGFGSDGHSRVELTQKAIERGEALAQARFPRERIFLIGDTQHDIDAGRALDLKTIAVATGRMNCDQLRLLSPDYVLENLLDREFFSSLLGANAATY